jgi:ABC-type transporter Mla MlaB component
MFKISSSNSSGKGVTLLLEGRILNHSIEQLRDSCERFLAQRRRLTLDLSGVSFICQDGVCILQRLEERHVTLINCSGFVAEQLKIKKGEKQE